MDRRVFEEQAKVMGEYFSANQMKGHLEKLRSFYRIQRGYRPATLDDWNEAFFTKWLAILRIPPHEHAMPIRPMFYKCEACRDDPTVLRKSAYTKIVFPDGVVSFCEGCGTEWLTLEKMTGLNFTDREGPATSSQ